MARAKEKVLVHYFKVAIAQDPRSSNTQDAADALAAVEGVAEVTFLRSSMKSKGDE